MGACCLDGAWCASGVCMHGMCTADCRQLGSTTELPARDRVLGQCCAYDQLCSSNECSELLNVCVETPVLPPEPVEEPDNPSDPQTDPSRSQRWIAPLIACFVIILILLALLAICIHRKKTNNLNKVAPPEEVKKTSDKVTDQHPQHRRQESEIALYPAMKSEEAVGEETAVQSYAPNETGLTILSSMQHLDVDHDAPQLEVTADEQKPPVKEAK